MDKSQLLKRLQEVHDVCKPDVTKCRLLGSTYLLEYIADAEISKAFDAMGKTHVKDVATGQTVYDKDV